MVEEKEPGNWDALHIRNAQLRDRDGLWSILVKGGTIAQITKEAFLAYDTAEIYDAEGRLVIPQFCENHIHLDYANTAGVPRDNQSGTLFEGIEIWRERKAQGLNVKGDIKANAIKAIRQCVSHGTGFIRTHVDVTDPELNGLKALLEVRDEVADWCEIQIVAFPQNGIFAFANGADLMRKAMEMGADVVGGIPHLEPTYEDGVKSLQFIFDLAEEFDAMVDVHCDEIDDGQSRFLDVMVAETTRRGMAERVTVSHAVAMGYYSPGYLARLLPKIKASGIGFAIAPRENLQLQGRGYGLPVPRGIAPVREIVDWEIRVALGNQDSIQDPFYPIGDGNPMRNLDTGLHVAHMLTPKYMDRCLDYVTANPATNMAIQQYGIEEARAGHLLVLDAKSDREALRSLPRVLLSVHSGREVFRQSVADIRWARH